jgi:hypothetical protein
LPTPHDDTLKILILSLFLLVLACLLMLTIQLPERAAAASACSTSSPTGAYTITLCLTNPTDGSTLSGPVLVSSTVSITGQTPGVQKIIYSLNSQYLLTDFVSPFSFTFPTIKFADGSNLPFSAQLYTNDGLKSQPVTIKVTLSNGNTVTPTNTSTFRPVTGTLPPPGQPFILAAVGDGAGGESPESDVVNLISSWNPNLFLYLGDVYDEGSPTEFYNWYAPSNFYGRFRAITDPTVGIHEYLMAPDPTVPYTPTGYIDYWGQVPNTYSFNAGGWHIISWNTNCVDAGGCKQGTPQYTWLQNDLQANTSTPCTLVFYHTPLYDNGPEATSFIPMSQTWSLMAQYGVDVVLNGNSHDYQRWFPLDGSGNKSANGIAEFIAGAGGHDVQAFVTADPRMAIGFDKSTTPLPFGALRLELYPNGTVYRYINTTGTTLDSGSLVCSGASGPVPPSPPHLLYLPLIAKQ